MDRSPDEAGATAAHDPQLRLRKLLSCFDHENQAVRDELRRWNQANPDVLATAAVRRLAEGQITAAERYLARLLGISGVYMKHLLDGATDLPSAIAAARVVANEDVDFFTRLMHTASTTASAGVIMRAFELVTALDRANIVVPWLQQMTHHRDSRIQSKAALIFCRLYGNTSLVQRQMSASDARVRANAIEALWRVQSTAARDVLDKAINDPHHRVALNAALGLYFLNPRTAAQRLIAFASHPDARFRAAAAWAIGQTGDAAFAPTLAALAQDADEHVRAAAARAGGRASSQADSLEDPACLK